MKFLFSKHAFERSLKQLLLSCVSPVAKIFAQMFFYTIFCSPDFFEFSSFYLIIEVSVIVIEVALILNLNR